MITKPDFLHKSVIVAAHPDDEILWFSSIMQRTDKIILVYEDFWAQPDLGQKRAAAIKVLPHDNVESLRIAEAGTNGCANWNAPVLSPFGIEFGSQALLRENKRLLKRTIPLGEIRDNTPDQSVWRNYCENFDLIRKRLDETLQPDMNVFTHNPWGEYGHEDHVQLFRILDHLRVKKGFKLWMSNYCTDRSLNLAMTYFTDRPIDYITLPTDKGYAEKVVDVYRKHDCWTWADNWRWFDEEKFMEAPSRQALAGVQAHLIPLNFFTI